MSEPASPKWWSPTRLVLAVFGSALILDSIFAVWGERRPVGGFFEEFIARSGHWLVLIGGFFGAMRFGFKAYEKSNSRFVGWAVGLAIFAAIGVGGGLLLLSIPGVDWRYERLQDSGEYYY